MRGMEDDYHPVVRETPRRVAHGLLFLCAIGLAAFSLYLALHRIYQVDEVQNVYMARTIATHRWKDFSTSAPLFLLGPLAWIARNGTTTAGILEANRLVFLGVFWLNIALLAIGAGARRADLKGMTLVLLAATFAPIWDYGFEIRHDNLLLTGILTVWILGRRAGVIPGTVRYALIGAVPVLLQFTAFKAFLYFTPMCGLMLLFPNPSLGLSRPRAWSSAAFGSLSAFLLARGAYAMTGAWDVYLNGFQGSVGVSQHVVSFSSWPALARLLPQTPVLVGGTAVFVALAVRNILTLGRRYVSWATTWPEALFLGQGLLVLFVNPTPFPYNLIFVVPQAFIAVVAGSSAIAALASGISRTVLRFALVGLALAHVGPFLAQTLRHLNYTNARQLELAAAAEAMTDPIHDRVYDGAGLVVTRDSIGYHMYLHSLTIRNFWRGTYPTVRSMLESHPASVLLPNYRTSWLREADQVFIRDHYIALSPDFLVLGAEISATGTWRCLKQGRYCVLVVPPDCADLVQVDGRRPPRRPVVFDEGPHFFDLPPNVRSRVVWVGPKLDRPPGLGPGAWQETFVNFY